MKRIEDKLAGDGGQTLAYLAVFIAAALAIAAFAIDIGMANVTRTRQSDMLQQSLSKCLEPATTMKVKNSPAPGPELARQMTSFLRDEGYNGSLEVYYYEPTASEAGISGDKRVYAFGARLTSETGAVFGVLQGTGAISTSVQAFSYSVLYAAEQVYRPAAVENGVYSVAAGSATGSWAPAGSVAALGDGAVSDGIDEALEAAKAKASQESQE